MSTDVTLSFGELIGGLVVCAVLVGLFMRVVFPSRRDGND